MAAIDSIAFRKLVARTDPRTIVEEHLVTPGAQRVTDSQINLIRSHIRLKFGMTDEQFDVYIVGSAKLGYSLSKKFVDGTFLPRYRNFRAASDIDVAVVSQMLYFRVWRGLSKYSHESLPFPWASERLGDYKVIGWLRPDYFPTINRPALCVEWWEIFGELTKHPAFNRQKVRGALYYNKNFLMDYQMRAVLECQREELGA